MPALLLPILFLLLSCSKQPRAEGVDLSVMKAKLDAYEGRYPTCNYPSMVGVSKDTCRSEGTGEGDGDVMLWSGLLCLSGEQLGCSTAASSFEINGKAHRSPGRLNDVNYSRDMFLGSLAYFLGSRDILTAQKHLNWLQNNKNNLCIHPCELTYATWGAAFIIWRWLGLPITLEMKIGNKLDEVGALPGVLINEGYQLHLMMVTTLLHQKTNSNTSSWKTMAKILHSRQPQNPFAAYLALGSNQSVVDLAVSRMPYTVPVERSQWSFEREQDSMDWHNSMLWEWKFLYNLLEAQ